MNDDHERERGRSTVLLVLWALRQRCNALVTAVMSADTIRRSTFVFGNCTSQR